jgi:hypothetical protein
MDGVTHHSSLLAVAVLSERRFEDTGPAVRDRL